MTAESSRQARGPKRSRVSAGLLMFRQQGPALELLLVHPGGPFFRGKDAGVWTIPKGEATPGEDLLERAEIEFAEELGIAAEGEWIELGAVQQKGGKVVHAWAFVGSLPEGFELRSNEFELEWPPRSGRRMRFPEVDQARFCNEAEARVKLNAAQLPFIERLRARLGI